MGIFKKLADLFNNQLIYIVDKETLIKYLYDEEKFCFDYNLEASFNLYLFINNEKIHIQMWNFKASKFQDEQSKGTIYYYNEKEYNSLNDLIKIELNNLPNYFKIQLINSDSTLLNDYKKQHPELKIEDY